MKATDRMIVRSLSTASLALLLVAATVVPRQSHAGRRLAVVVGSNMGGTGDAPLRFAQRDARRIAQVLRELGSVEPADLHLLLEPKAGEVLERLQELLARNDDADSYELLMFYYSGHADEHSLRMGSSRLAWTDLRGVLTESERGLRVAMVDACQAGMLTEAKGFTVDTIVEQDGGKHAQGYALMVAAESVEIAQESLALGGSYFTHFLISALRGAGDVDGDGRVTLSEAHSYATKNTRRATSMSARSVQHPAYHFDITGHGDVVLTDLRRATAKLHLSSQMAGHLVVTERGSSLVAAETQKERGRDMTLALPNGRYVVHLRKSNAVFLEEVTLPWGGAAAIDEQGMTAQTYQAVAQKHGVVEVYRNRVRLTTVARSAIVPGTGIEPVARLELGRKVGWLELSLRGSAGGGQMAAVDTRIRNRVFGLGAALAYERPVGLVDLRVHAALVGLYWDQRVKRQGRRTSYLLGLGIGAGARVPIALRLFAEAGLGTTSYILRERRATRSVRQSLAGSLSLGWMF